MATAVTEKLLETTPVVDAEVVEETAQHEPVEEATAVPSVAVASPEAAPVTSKRAAKKSKKTPKTEDASGDADADSNGNIAATIDHPYLSFLHKRIRLYKKKLEKIKALAAAQATEGKVLNDQQQELVGSKALVEKMITEFETLREQFIEVFVKEEAEKRAAEKTKASVAVVAVVEPTPVPVAEKEETKEKEEEPKKEEEEAVVTVTVPRDAFAYVEDLLRTLHAVTLHQALGEDVPMVLDYFSKVLLGTTRPPAEVPFDENLAESLEEATRYLTKSDKPVVMDVTYQDLRAMVEKLGAVKTSEPEEEAVEETAAAAVVSVEAPGAEQLPHINFFTDSQLDNATEDKTNEHHAAPEAIETPVSEEEQPQADGETKTAPVTKKPRSRKPNPAAAVTASGDEKPPQRRRSQNRSKNHSNDNSPRGTGEGKTLESGKGDNNGAGKPRRSRAPRSNDENGGSHNANRSSSAGGKPDRPRTERPVRKPQPQQPQQQHKATAQA